MSNKTSEAHLESTLFGHPTGLFILFFTEMWERFSYYGMRALLVLYMTTETMGDSRGAGLGWSSQEALALYGWYTMLVYVMSIPGGMLADKLLGQKKARSDWSNHSLSGTWGFSVYTNLGFLCWVGVGNTWGRFVEA